MAVFKIFFWRTKIARRQVEGRFSDREVSLTPGVYRAYKFQRVHTRTHKSRVTLGARARAAASREACSQLGRYGTAREEPGRGREERRKEQESCVFKQRCIKPAF